MHRDTKLGLALAILVMGFAAALCFPRTPGESTENLALKTAQELDSGIRLGQVKTYTDADRPKPRVPEVVEVTPSVPVPVEGTEAGLNPVEAQPDTVAVVPGSEPTPVNPASLPPEVVAEPEPAVVHHRTYTVKDYDTLSSIAKEHLEDGNRWREIYDANRDKMADERSLRPGTVLVIPIPEGDELSPALPESLPVASAPGTAAPQRVTPTSPVQSPVRKRLFSSPTSRIGSAAEPRLQ